MLNTIEDPRKEWNNTFLNFEQQFYFMNEKIELILIIKKNLIHLKIKNT